MYEISNLGNSSPITLKEMIDIIGELVGITPKINQMPMQPSDVDKTYADYLRLKECLVMNLK